MTIQRQDFDMHANETKIITVSMIDGTNLTGSTIQWVLKQGGVTGATIVTKNITGSGTAFTVTLTAADTQGKNGQFYHEAKMTDSAGHKSTITKGTITIEKSAL